MLRGFSPIYTHTIWRRKRKKEARQRPNFSCRNCVLKSNFVEPSSSGLACSTFLSISTSNNRSLNFTSPWFPDAFDLLQYTRFDARCTQISYRHRALNKSDSIFTPTIFARFAFVLFYRNAAYYWNNNKISCANSVKYMLFFFPTYCWLHGQNQQYPGFAVGNTSQKLGSTMKKKKSLTNQRIKSIYDWK